MNNSQILVPFAENGKKNDIPQNGTASDVLASLELGFPPLTMQKAGGTPPDGRDMNGILHLICSMLQYVQAGGFFPYNAAFAQAVGGYPAGARVLAADRKSLWVNLVAGNTSDPDNNGNGWQLQGITPAAAQIGDIRMWHRPTIPANALLCDGREVRSDDYPALYSAWYGDFQAGQLFTLPNLSDGYYPKGYGPSTQALGTRQTGALPNITGDFFGETLSQVDAVRYVFNGAFFRTDKKNYPGIGQSDNDNYQTGFDASRCSAVYGNRNTKTVETNNVALNFIVFFA